MTTRMSMQHNGRTAQSQRQDTRVIENPGPISTGVNEAPSDPGMYRVGSPGHRPPRRVRRVLLALEKLMPRLAVIPSVTEVVCLVYPEKPLSTCAGRGGNE